MADSDIAYERWFVFPCESFAGRCVWFGPSASDDVAVAQLATAVPRVSALPQRPKLVRPTVKPEPVRHSDLHVCDKEEKA